MSQGLFPEPIRRIAAGKVQPRECVLLNGSQAGFAQEIAVAGYRSSRAPRHERGMRKFFKGGLGRGNVLAVEFDNIRFIRRVECLADRVDAFASELSFVGRQPRAKRAYRMSGEIPAGLASALALAASSM